MENGSTTWSKLKDVKNSCPVELVEHAVNNKANDEPEFSWWAPHALKKKSQKFSKIKSKHWQKTHECGIEIPKSVQDVIRLDCWR